MDTTSVFGHANPDICGSNSLTEICAFGSEDGICRKLSRACRKSTIN